MVLCMSSSVGLIDDLCCPHHRRTARAPVPATAPSIPPVMSEETSIQVNFGRPLPLFPLDAVTLLPQQLLPLHIFEERYRQMVEHALDGSGQLAMAVLDGSGKGEEGNPPIRPAVCIGQIAQHET